jgi:hypothetical protein
VSVCHSLSYTLCSWISLWYCYTSTQSVISCVSKYQSYFICLYLLACNSYSVFFFPSCNINNLYYAPCRLSRAMFNMSNESCLCVGFCVRIQHSSSNGLENVWYKELRYQKTTKMSLMAAPFLKLLQNGIQLKIW